MKRILLLFIFILVIALLAEGISWVILFVLIKKEVATENKFKTNENLQVDRKNLKAGFSETLGQAIITNLKNGEKFAANTLIKLSKEHNIGKNDVIYKINHHGFKGPNIDNTHSKQRILSIGDSCTFGSLIDKFSYPRALERFLARINWNAEVINGGASGATTKIILDIIKKYKKLKPEIILIYIGLNDLIREKFPKFVPQKKITKPYLNINKLIERIYILLKGKKQNYHENFNNKLKEKISDEFIPSFMKNVEKIILEMKSINSLVVLFTLPKIYGMDKNSYEKFLLKKVNSVSVKSLPVLSKLVVEYNKNLRIIAKKHQVIIIDLESWVDSDLKPQSEYFNNSVCLNEAGQVKLGFFIGRKLLKYKAKFNLSLRMNETLNIIKRIKKGPMGIQILH